MMFALWNLNTLHMIHISFKRENCIWKIKLMIMSMYPLAVKLFDTKWVAAASSTVSPGESSVPLWSLRYSYWEDMAIWWMLPWLLVDAAFLRIKLFSALPVRFCWICSRLCHYSIETNKNVKFGNVKFEYNKMLCPEHTVPTSSSYAGRNWSRWFGVFIRICISGRGKRRAIAVAFLASGRPLLVHPWINSTNCSNGGIFLI